MHNLFQIGRPADLGGDYLLEKRLVLAAPPAALGRSRGGDWVLLDLLD